MLFRSQAVSTGSSDQKNGVKFDQEFRSEERRRQIRAGEDFRQAGVSRLGKVELGFRSGDSRPVYIDTGAPWLRGQVQFVSEKCSSTVRRVSTVCRRIFLEMVGLVSKE